MQKAFVRMKGIGLTAFIMLAINVAMLFALAVAVYYGKLQLNYCEVLLPIGIIVSAIIAGYIGTQTFDEGVWLLLAGVIFAVCTIVLLCVTKCSVHMGGSIKAITAAVVGVFLGNFLKKRIHNKLRKNKKHRRVATK